MEKTVKNTGGVAALQKNAKKITKMDWENYSDDKSIIAIIVLGEVGNQKKLEKKSAATAV